MAKGICTCGHKENVHTLTTEEPPLVGIYRGNCRRCSQLKPCVSFENEKNKDG